jgi:hypothetical protein
MRPIVIHRQRKHEAEQAVKDLLERGFEIVMPITEVSRDGKVFDRDSMNRRIFRENTFSSCWRAILRKVE